MRSVRPLDVFEQNHHHQIMNKTIKNLAVTLVLTLVLCFSARAETLTIASTTATPVWCSPLVSGTPYCIQANKQNKTSHSPECSKECRRPAGNTIPESQWLMQLSMFPLAH